MKRFVFKLFFFLFLSFSVFSQTVKINEFMASNATTISDSYGDFDDWIELYNYGNDTVDIGGCYITDKLDNPIKHRIPSGFIETKIPPKGYLILWADDDTLQDGPIHLKFKLSVSGEAIGLFGPDGTTVIDSLSFGQQITDISYGRYPDGADSWVYFNFPSPGAPNTLVGMASDFVVLDKAIAYPNPSNGQVIHFNKEIDFELFNIKGQLINTYRNTDHINTSGLPAGFYIVKTGNGQQIKISVKK